MTVINFKIRKEAFSLVEILISMFIMAIGGLVAVILLGNYIGLFTTDEEATLIRRRAADAMHMLELPILNAGLGIPPQNIKSPDINGFFSQSFTPSVASNRPVFAYWEKPLSLGTIVTNYGGSNKRSEDVLQVVYAMPSGVFLVEGEKGQINDSSKTGTIRVSGQLSDVSSTEGHMYPNRSTSTNNWITFPGQSRPLSIRSNPAQSGNAPVDLGVGAMRAPVKEGTRDESLRAFDEILYIRSLAAWIDYPDVSRAKLNVLDVYGTSNPGVINPSVYRGDLQEVFGVLRLSCDISPNNRDVTVEMLIRGETRDRQRVDRVDPALVTKWNLTNAEREYILDTFSVTWRVRNVGSN